MESILGLSVQEILGKEFFEILSDFKKDFRPIDLDDLHTEWVTLCNLVNKYSKLLYGDEDQEGLEAKRSYYKSDLAKDLRAKDPKMSEVKTTNKIEEDKTYISLTQKVHLLRGALETLKTRSRALEQICKLWIAQYWNSSNDKADKQQQQREGLKNERG